MSAPPMPAKEVVPEFGFREASPGVAAAALALRGGKERRLLRAPAVVVGAAPGPLPRRPRRRRSQPPTETGPSGRVGG